MHTQWLTDPLQLALLALAAHRLTHLWLFDMLPPLPRLRDAITRHGSDRWRRRMDAARAADKLLAREVLAAAAQRQPAAPVVTPEQVAQVKANDPALSLTDALQGFQENLAKVSAAFMGTDRTPNTNAERTRQDRAAGMPAEHYLTSCAWCCGVWFGAGVCALAVALPFTWWAVPAAVLAISSVIGLVETRGSSDF